MPPIETSATVLSLWAVLSYLLGSIPFGMVLAKGMNLGNLREIGSGSIGATNVLRTGSKTAAALTLILDGAKGAVAVLLARALAGEDAAQLAALMALIGHCYPIWLGFKGGKGVATFLGVMLALAWPIGLGCCLAWLAVAAVIRISSASSLSASVAGIVLVFVLARPELILLTMCLAAIIFLRHKDNISRLRAGVEPKIGQKS